MSLWSLCVCALFWGFICDFLVKQNHNYGYPSFWGHLTLISSGSPPLLCARFTWLFKLHSRPFVIGSSWGFIGGIGPISTHYMSIYCLMISFGPSLFSWHPNSHLSHSWPFHLIISSGHCHSYLVHSCLSILVLDCLGLINSWSLASQVNFTFNVLMIYPLIFGSFNHVIHSWNIQVF